MQEKFHDRPLKPLRSEKWLDWQEFCVHQTSAGLPPNFQWTSRGLYPPPRNPCGLQWISVALLQGQIGWYYAQSTGMKDTSQSSVPVQWRSTAGSPVQSSFLNIVMMAQYIVKSSRVQWSSFGLCAPSEELLTVSLLLLGKDPALEYLLLFCKKNDLHKLCLTLVQSVLAFHLTSSSHFLIIFNIICISQGTDLCLTHSQL